MPTYDYRCTNCGRTFEEFQSISAEPLADCPKCGTPSLKRVFGGGAGMIFKGSGFYLTDYKSTKPESSSKPSAESSKTDSTSSGESSKKPESKAGDPSQPSSE